MSLHSSECQSSSFDLCEYMSTVVFSFEYIAYPIYSIIPHTNILQLFHSRAVWKQTLPAVTKDIFYPRDAMLARVFATATCPDVRLSVCHTPVLCLAERKQDREMYTSDSPMTLVSGKV